MHALQRIPFCRTISGFWIIQLNILILNSFKKLAEFRPKGDWNLRMAARGDKTLKNLAKEKSLHISYGTCTERAKNAELMF